jgi:hypothetical protein
MEVKIKTLEKIVTLLLSKLRDEKGDVLQIESDFYWDISDDEIFNPYEQPSMLTLGQLSDDINEVMRLEEFEDEALAIDLKRVGRILISLSIENTVAF